MKQVLRNSLAACFCICGVLYPASTFAEDTILTVLVVHPNPTLGHTGVHLKRGDEQMYWDPGGSYGTELDECLDVRSTPNCEGFYGFPWAELKRARKNDVFDGDMADLLRVITIYHLNGDKKNQAISFSLTGDLAELAWALIADGRQNSDKATLKTNRNAPYCTRAVSEYFRELGGPFRDIQLTWYPMDLGKQLLALNPTDTKIYTIDNELVQKTISMVRGVKSSMSSAAP